MLIGLLSAIGVVLLVSGRWTPREAGAFLLILAGFFGFLLALIQFCQRLGRPDRLELLAFLETLGVQD